VDVIVTPFVDQQMWQLTDLLGRPMGHIAEDPPAHFTISPEGQAVRTMSGMMQGPYASLDAALAAIEKHTRGVCRRSS
jgi:hypothetical protein